jgi:hypothetical protein
VNNKENGRACVGGHRSADYSDAVKGAITNGFKKASAFWGVGADAYRGTIDDDNVPGEEVDYTRPIQSKPLTENQKEFARLVTQITPEAEKQWYAKLDAETTPEGKTRVLGELREFVKSIDRTPAERLEDDPGLDAAFEGEEKPVINPDLF